jgi:hypothetical protein
MIKKSDFDPNCITVSQMKLIFNARMYYKRLTAWARAYILSRYFGVGTADELFGRLYLEALDQADVLKIFFSRQDAEKYGDLLGRTVILLRDIISDQINGDMELMAVHISSMAQNIEDRVAFLHSLSSYINEEEYRDMLRAYIRTLLDYANILAAGDYGKDIEIYNSLDELADRIGDAFAESLYNYMTSGSDTKGAAPGSNEWCITYDQLNTVFGTKMFWFNMEIWTRNYMLSRVLGLGPTDRVYEHLRHVVDDYVRLVEQVFGKEAAEAYDRLFDRYVELIDAFVTAQMEGDTERVNEIVPLLYENVRERANIPIEAGPYFNEEVWIPMVENKLRYTIDEFNAFLTGDYPRSLDIFNTLLNQAESMGNEFEKGYFNYMGSSQAPAKENKK